MHLFGFRKRDPPQEETQSMEELEEMFPLQEKCPLNSMTMYTATVKATST